MEPMEATGHAGTAEDIVPYGTFVKVWAALLALTGLLVLVSRLKHDPLAVWALLTVTPLKAALVFYFFMHLKWEPVLLKVMLFVALAALMVFLGLLFFDIGLR